MYQRGKIQYQLNAIKKFNYLQWFIFYKLHISLFFFGWHELLFCAESHKSGSRTWSMNG